jgi:hypothetical protein
VIDHQDIDCAFLSLDLQAKLMANRVDHQGFAIGRGEVLPVGLRIIGQ